LGDFGLVGVPLQNNHHYKRNGVILPSGWSDVDLQPFTLKKTNIRGAINGQKTTPSKPAFIYSRLLWKCPDSIFIEFGSVAGPW
jgi:hypothetical protein